MKKTLFTALIFLMAFAPKGNAQSAEDLNNYKYVIIPLQYDWQSEDNQYLMNSLTKFLLKKQGFKTLMESDEKPEDLKFNNCLALQAKIVSNGSSMFSFVTRTTLELKNCQGEVVFKTKEGTSRTKEIKKSMHEALRDAFTSFEGVSYAYNGGNGYFGSQKADVRGGTVSKEGDVRGGTVSKEGDVRGRAVSKKKEGSGMEDALKSTFRFNNSSYVLQKIEAGYVLKDRESGDRVAVLNVTNSDNILYNSDTLNGTASLSDNGNIVVEYFDTVTESVKQITYENIGER